MLFPTVGDRSLLLLSANLLCPNSHACRPNNGIEFQVRRIQTKNINEEVDFTSLDLTYSVG